MKSDQPAPVASLAEAGKANCVLCGVLGTDMEVTDKLDDDDKESSQEGDTDEAEEENTSSFNIEIVFPRPDQFTPEERQKITDAAQKWERVVVGDMPEYVVPYDQAMSSGSDRGHSGTSLWWKG